MTDMVGQDVSIIKAIASGDLDAQKDVRLFEKVAPDNFFDFLEGNNDPAAGKHVGEALFASLHSKAVESVEDIQQHLERDNREVNIRIALSEYNSANNSAHEGKRQKALVGLKKELAPVFEKQHKPQKSNRLSDFIKNMVGKGFPNKPSGPSMN